MTDRGDRARTTRRDLQPRTITPSAPAPAPSRTRASTAGQLAATAWLAARKLRAAQGASWSVEIGLEPAPRAAPVQWDPRRATRFQLHIRAEEWGFRFCHQSRESRIRVTDVAFVHGNDHHGLLAATPPLKNVGAFLRDLEQRFGLTFQRRHAAIVTTLSDGERAIQGWLASL